MFESIKTALNIGICSALCVTLSFLVLLMIIMGKFAFMVFTAG